MLVGEPEKALDQLEPLLKIPYYLSPGWLKGAFGLAGIGELSSRRHSSLSQDQPVPFGIRTASIRLAIRWVFSAPPESSSVSIRVRYPPPPFSNGRMLAHRYSSYFPRPT